MLMVKQPIAHGTANERDPILTCRSQQEGPEGGGDTREVQEGGTWKVKASSFGVRGRITRGPLVAQGTGVRPWAGGFNFRKASNTRMGDVWLA